MSVVSLVTVMVSVVSVMSVMMSVISVMSVKSVMMSVVSEVFVSCGQVLRSVLFCLARHLCCVFGMFWMACCGVWRGNWFD
jgi:hypothetical protein